jgi:predicted PurR-regulated permease PerM
MIIAIALVALAIAVWLLSQILLLIFAAVLVAVILRALASPLLKIGVAEEYGVLVAVLVLLVILSTGAFLFGATLFAEMQNLTQTLSMSAEQWTQRLQLTSFVDLIRGESVSSIGTIASQLFAWSWSLFGALGSIVLVLFGGVYLATDPRDYRAGVLKLLPFAVRERARPAFADAYEALQRWLKAQVLAMTIVGAMTGLGLWLIGSPSALALGIIAGFAEFVPIVGPVVSAIPIVLVAGAQDWQMALWALGVVVLVQQVESNLVTPIVIGQRVAIAPAVALFSIVGLGALFGPLGVLLGFPLTIVLDVAVRRLYVADTLEEDVELLGRPVEADTVAGEARRSP